MAYKLDDLEQHSRKSCIRINGVHQKQDEDTTNIVCEVAKTLDVDLDPNDISVSHRLQTEKWPKQITARFTHANKDQNFRERLKTLKMLKTLKVSV